MKVTTEYLIICALVTVTSAQFDRSWSDSSNDGTQSYTKSRPNQSSGQPAAVTPTQEQRAINFQNRALERLFLHSFPATIPVEFRDAVVELYFHSQRELDVCAEFLWETHLLKEYRRCATLTRLAISRQVKILAEEIRELTVAENDYLDY
ncbi:uncharacterized protein LOC131681798 [Topomyia yanbarensis]|uniref:uncharacterized protein LOC131681798 n=1 Tax=Topomyia yanbarensis TaxID=2498891 RepID=UPI00273B56BD|nr:uncharacterized protein LOC131681798 [Topomyia yanbarensis]